MEEKPSNPVKNRLAILFAFAPLWMAVIYAPALTAFSGPGYTTTVNQDSILFLFLGFIGYPFFMIVPVFISQKLADKNSKKNLAFVGFISWLVSPIIVYALLSI
jgi:Na+/melibiose symporter-like transporter